MVTAIVLMSVERGQVSATAESLADLKQISEVYSVGGRYDLVAVIRVRTNEELAETVTKHLAGLKAIKNTETLIAFRSYSRHDLEAMFSLGLEE